MVTGKPFSYAVACGVLSMLGLIATAEPIQAQCQRTLTADVVALDQPLMLNRLGSSMPGAMIYALKQDVMANDGSDHLQPGEVMLRPGKRPRPIVLRMNVGDCLQVVFTNYLAQQPVNAPPPTGQDAIPWTDQTATRQAGVHVFGMQLIGSINSDGSWVGANATSLVDPGNTITYQFYAQAEGTYLLYSTAADMNSNMIGFGDTGGGNAGQLTSGLFGAVNVEPANAEWYRSQVTNDDLKVATYNANSLPSNMTLTPQGGNPSLYTLTTVNGQTSTTVTVTKAADGSLQTPDGHPLINYSALYPSTYPDAWRRCTPILKVLDIGYTVTATGCSPVPGSPLQLYHSDLTAIITGPNAGEFPYSENSPEFFNVPVSPFRRQPFREFTIHYHETQQAVQAFPEFYSPQLGSTISVSGDQFAINYGVGGIGAEILANRFGLGPQGSCVECKFEEFFLSSWPVGDPAMVVDVPANAPATPDQLFYYSQGDGPAPTVTTGTRVPPTGVPFKIQPLVKASVAQYPDDPSNVYHSYLRDHVKFRLLHAGAFLTHVHHLHAHQWLHSPNSSTGDYLDSQMINPGATYTLEMVHNGSGNLNETVGDAIFHCHFYPHFAAGMWAHWRVHDVFEMGTQLQNGQPIYDPTNPNVWNRALPDGEIKTGTPTPAVVPLPTLAMASMPARVKVCPAYGNWTQSMFVGTGCPPAPSGAQPIGYAVLVNQTDLNAGLNPGYPFFIPGIAGHRPPHPPLDFAKNPDTGQPLDGGLPRHLILDGTLDNEHHNQWDFSKDNFSLTAIQLDEAGTPAEKLAMNIHATRAQSSFTPEGMSAPFLLNGLPPVPGAPYANPGMDADGNPVAAVRQYRGANVQMDVVFNKKGWHFPQQRFITLWEDVQPTLQGNIAPEPFFIRANTGEVVEYWHTNLVPDYYELDDFQVRTPTDILGQHIHLVKFDVTSSDGAANGFNYEDGTFSPDEVQKRIAAINQAGGLLLTTGTKQTLTVQAPYYFCTGPNPPPQYCQVSPTNPTQSGQWVGAQTTIQRWYADPVLNNRGDDRTLRTVFTHDHFGPSTHQQAGLYAGLLVEPAGSQWFIPAYRDPTNPTNILTNVPMGTRADGGPTSWQADIVTANPADSYREFMLEFQEMALAYTKDSPTKATPYPTGGNYPTSPAGYITAKTPLWGWANCPNAINIQKLLTNGNCPATPTDDNLAAQPQIISAGGFLGTMTVNYRNEPLPFRVWDPVNNQQPTGDPGDLSHVYRSITRSDPDLNCQPTGSIKGNGCASNPQNTKDPNGFNFPWPFIGAQGTDPYTPLMRAYEGDKVQIRVLVGAHMMPHFFTAQGFKWLFEPTYTNSGYRATQGMGISEHFEFLFTAPGAKTSYQNPFADYLYVPGTGQSDQMQGLWGIFRAYDGAIQKPSDLPVLPNNPTGSAPAPMASGCPAGGAPVRSYQIAATTAAQALQPLPGQSSTTPGTLVYNTRGSNGNPGPDPIHQPDALIYVQTKDLDGSGKLLPNVPIEPLVLRAAAGDCIRVTLTNGFNPNQQDQDGNQIFFQAKLTYDSTQKQWNTTGTSTTVPILDTKAAPPQYDLFIPIAASTQVGLHPQLVSYDITKSNGANIGFNPPTGVTTTGQPIYQSVPPGSSITYTWYAGNFSVNDDGSINSTPVESGAINLLPSDPLQQDPSGLVGALIIEPQGSSWCEDVNSRASASVFLGTVNCNDPNSRASLKSFREFVVVMQNDLSGLTTWDNGQQNTVQGINYRTEPMNYRFQSNVTNIADGTSNSLPFSKPPTTVIAPIGQPQMPIFVAKAGTPVRFRMLHPGGTGDGQNVTIHGHLWPEEPYVNNSTKIRTNPASQFLGSWNHGPDNHLDIVIDQAGGQGKVTGDYLYRTFFPDQFAGGLWGLFRVTASDSVVINSYGPCPDQPGKYCVSGANTVNPDTGRFESTVTIFPGKDSGRPALGTAPVHQFQGGWTFTFNVPPGSQPPATVTVKSTGGGVAEATLAQPVLRAAPAALTGAAARRSAASTAVKQSLVSAGVNKKRQQNILRLYKRSGTPETRRPKAQTPAPPPSKKQ